MVNVVNVVASVMVIFILPTVYTNPLVPVPLLDQESAPLVANLDMTKIKSYIDNEVKNEINSLRQLELSGVEKDINNLKHDVKSLQNDLKDMQKVMTELHTSDCTDLKGKVFTSGVYRVYLGGPPGFEMFCDMETDGGGWTVIQRRINGSVDFYRNWADYERGFGDIRTEFWLGNSKLHKLTSQGNYELRVDLEDFDGNKPYANYSTFSIGDNATNYKLNVGGYSGTAGDSLVYHNGRPFSTYDRDNDSSKINCADVYKGAWWYNNCHYSNLNGLYLGNKVDAKGISWYHWKSKHQSMKTTSMMFRRKK